MKDKVQPTFAERKYYGNMKDNLVLKLKWWQRTILWFKPAYIGVDLGVGDKGYYTIVKRFGDKTIVLYAGELPPQNNKLYADGIKEAIKIVESHLYHCDSMAITWILEELKEKLEPEE